MGMVVKIEGGEGRPGKGAQMNSIRLKTWRMDDIRIAHIHIIYGFM